MNILEKIILHKQKEVEEKKSLVSVSKLEESVFFERKAFSLKKIFQNSAKPQIIAEFKRKSPSKGIINDAVSPEIVGKAYEKAGAAGISVLTDSEFFGGSDEDLKSVRQRVEIPVLRKEFMIDEYQIIEAKAIGADLILLIAACLETQQLKKLAEFAKNLALEVLMEVHNLDELNLNLNEFIDFVGVNNRNLKTFEVSIQTSIALAEKIPADFIKISESGIHKPETIGELWQYGYKGFLMGESFMKSKNPGEELATLIGKIGEI